jgi:hypothetical protein
MGKWDGVKSPKILDAMRVALSDDRLFSHSEVVDLVRAALDDGILTPSKLSDLWIIARNSDTMPARSIVMLWYLVEQTREVVGKTGSFSLTTSQQQSAADAICSFLKRMGNGFFPHLNRDRVGIDLLLRVGNPGIMYQDRAGLCGPFAFVFGLASDSPQTYVRFAVELYERGVGRIGHLYVKPSDACRNYSPPNKMSPADWLTAASLRDSTNGWFNVDHDVDSFWNNLASGADVGDIERWFEQSGYTDVKSEDNILSNLDASDIDDLNRYYSEGRRVVLCINSAMLYAAKQTDTTHGGNHIVGLHSPIARTSHGVRLTLFTWGHGDFQIPQGAPLSEKDFLDKLYGYVAGKPF